MSSVSEPIRARSTIRRSGFTLVEILIVVVILGILATFVIALFAGATQDARKSSLKSQLQTVRGAVQLYRVQHRDIAPDLVGSDWAAFTGKTDDNGAVSTDNNDWGPYMQAKPINPLAESSTISASAAAGVGWVYDSRSGTVTATADKNGALFNEAAN